MDLLRYALPLVVLSLSLSASAQAITLPSAPPALAPTPPSPRPGRSPAPTGHGTGLPDRGWVVNFDTGSVNNVGTDNAVFAAICAEDRDVMSPWAAVHRGNLANHHRRFA